MTETQFYSRGTVSVTSSMANFGNTSYPIANIGAVSVEEEHEGVWGAVIGLAIIGIIGMTFGGFGVIVGLGAWGFAAFLLYSGGKTTYHLSIRTSSGNTQAFSSTKKREIEEIRSAIVKAIAEKG